MLRVFEGSLNMHAHMLSVHFHPSSPSGCSVFVFVEIIAVIFKTIVMATQRLMHVDRICCRVTERLKKGDKRWEER